MSLRVSHGPPLNPLAACISDRLLANRKFIAKVIMTVLRNLWHFSERLRGKSLGKRIGDDDAPLRSELFSRAQMKQHGAALAGAHKLSVGRASDQLLTRLTENERVLISIRNLLADAVRANRRITPAGEWLLDNFYLIEEQIRMAKRHLPKGYSRELPRLLKDPSHHPRVYHIALETISHSDGRVDPEALSSFVASYQTITPLKLGELWAIPIMLRLALIENLRRVGARIATDKADQNCADRWADEMTEVAGKDPKNLILVVADMARSNPPASSSFVAEFARRLQGQSTALALPLTWIEQWLSEAGGTIEKSVQSENQQQAADQVSISNSISSLRFLSAMDWREFVETMSIVEQTLRTDPGGIYGKMDFATRDRYRHVVEKIAKNSKLSEGEVAGKAIQLAIESAARKIPNDREAHVGFYLIDRGVPQFERAAEVRKSIPKILHQMGRRFPLLLYLSAILTITVLFAGGLLGEAYTSGVPDLLLILMSIPLLLCGSHLAIALVNWLATSLSTPAMLPRMDFSAGIPPECRALVVIPTMLSTLQNVEDLSEALEVRFLANRDDNLHFGLLTDFPDAQKEILPEDGPLLQLARQRIEELNQKYGNLKGGAFFLFHRPRRWNPGEKIWMGYERKRGKLAELNSLLRGGAEDHFSVVVGATAILSNVKYVITLDTDTQLPRDSACQFIGTMAHPLNRARYDESKQRICDGYGILQPLVAASMQGSSRSRYARLFGSEPGIDPYTRAVSDVYQDLFQEGSFIGKGIYDVDVFERALQGRFPENRILSHDLVEGCYARSGLLSDVLLYEEHPFDYGADVNRRHRWIRGDWQIARWLLPGAPGLDGHRQRNTLSGLSRWKIFDNLRRSLVAAALTVLLLVGWRLFSPSWFWTLSLIGVILIPALTTGIIDLLRKPEDVLPSHHLASGIHGLTMHLAQAAFMLLCLPYEAFFSLDAIVRTGIRMHITHRRMLEWSPSVQTDRHCRTNAKTFWRTMWFAPAVAIAAATQLALTKPAALGVAAPMLALWFASPMIAWWISRPLVRRTAQLTSEQKNFLHKLSRKTWAYFETFVGQDDHWLPPDNFQEHPVAVVAHRTSPTNMGLALLANLSAYDFGYIPTGQLIERTTNTLRTMGTLKRYKGHFYNWYDTLSLEPLFPLYISTVDSGNLAGHLLTLRQGLLALPDNKILEPRLLDGIRDTLGILVDATQGSASAQLVQLQDDLRSLLLPTTLAEMRQLLGRWTVSAAAMVKSLDDDPKNPAKFWAHALSRQCQQALEELDFLVPWILQPGSSDRLLGFPDFETIPTLRELTTLEMPPAMEDLSGSEEIAKLRDIRRVILLSAQRAKERMAIIESLALQSSEFAGMEYDFLFDKGNHLLTIGYNVSERRRDSSYYDLLASEARFCSFVAIAQGQLPQENWFALGRLLTGPGGQPVLLSWSGSMFEYLMPLLVMPTHENTLLDQTYRAAVERQIEYGKKRGVAWGISESGYNALDVHSNYQYRAFGVPSLGLKRGLAEDLVIAPYASVLALMVAPEEACRNLERLSAEGLEGKYGLYEAIDYTPSHLPRGQSSAVVRSFMAHHEGMSFLSLAFLLLDHPMQKRFEADPSFQATMLLLHERIPKASAFYWHTAELSDHRTAFSGPETSVRIFKSPHTPIPEVQLLSNGRYHVMVTNAGGSYSCWKNIAVTRWREDSTCDGWGTFCYIRDVANGEFWSTGYQPTIKKIQSYEAIFSEARAEFRCRNQEFDTHTEISVSPEDDIELRRVHITNRSRTRRTIEVTSYAEVVLESPVADALHPAFGNLFVQTEIIHQRQAILCTRRPRSDSEEAPWMFHLMAVHGADIGEASYETDRMRFIGRRNSVANPQAITGSSKLSNSEGSVLDPIVAIRHQITIEPEKTATINIVTGIGATREECLSLVEKYQDRRLAGRVLDLAWTHNQIVLRQINASEADAQLYGRLASSVIYANSSLRADTAIILKNDRGQSGLWGYAISGDFPIVLLRIGDAVNIELVRQLVQAHAYWRLKGLAVDLVIWNEEHAGYRQGLHEQIMGLIAAGTEANVTDRPGGIFVRPVEQMSEEDRILLQTVARVIISDNRGSLADQINRRGPVAAPVPHLLPARTNSAEPLAIPAIPRRDLIFFNGLGGFTPDGREYVITTTEGQGTPAPWVNVLANPHFGTVVSESGLGYTWSENAHEFRLTPWANDPVSDSSGEALYIRDEESGHFWSPTPLPSPGATPYATRHGFGYSIFEHTESSIRSELQVYVAMDVPIKFMVLRLRNESGRSRRLTATGYVEWVLGNLRPKTIMHVVTEVDQNSRALFARNPYNAEFGSRVAFFTSDDEKRTITCDRMDFIGRNGTLRNPAAMTQAHLSGKLGAALDPCAAIQVPFELAAGEEREFIFRLGVGNDAEDAGNLANRFQGSLAARGALEGVWQYWNQTLGAVQVETPDPSLNVLVNGWLVYQTLACRLWARNGYYQPGGAFGFRDQLQDVMALIHAEPKLVREHLLRCASRQFPAGDVQHWWHPPSGRGVRTQCSDDFLWLPLATSRYVLSTGDTGVLDEPVHFIEGRPVSAEEDSYYDLPNRSEKVDSLYKHCVQAIERGLRFGTHGLPLIGSGDWNDGMNMVGERGQGESIWLGFFLHEVLMQFRKVARGYGDAAFAERCERDAAQVGRNIEQNGWDGEWYRRAYFDNGLPLGSASNPECQIDSIAQSWSVLSGAGKAERSRLAMEAVDRRLVRRDHGLIQLLDPPFDKSELNPGYIKGYVPGVRENGGQYTHAAIWAAMAFAELGDKQRAWELFSMINPVNHSKTPEQTDVYKVEPYVVAADVYALAPHTGRGGWTWYTGSASWLYRFIVESLLGLKLEIDKLRFAPCLPADWKPFKIHYRYRETLYHITILQTFAPKGGMTVTIDGMRQEKDFIPLVNDRREHTVEVKL
jgi:cyclic beta-1,2-glucan synthetase